MNIREHFTRDTYGNDQCAQRERNRRARDLRKQGYVVCCSTWDFADLARVKDYALDARKP